MPAAREFARLGNIMKRLLPAAGVGSWLMILGCSLAHAAPVASPVQPTETPAAEPEPRPVACIYGRLEDGHRGFVRCLGADEVGAAWLPPGVPPPPADSVPVYFVDAEPEPVVPAPAPVIVAARVEFSGAKFENGEVPRAEKLGASSTPGLAKCVEKAGGLKSKKGSVEVKFLVRSRGLAEGVEVGRHAGISDEALPCIRALFKGKGVGAPSDDPVGVTMQFSLLAEQDSP